MTETIDLTTCDREPIHIPGAIQPHGVLVALDGERLTITHVSANAAQLIGAAPEELFGRTLDALLIENEQGEAARWHRDLAQLKEGRPAYQSTWELRHAEEPWDAITHRYGDKLFIELERSPETSGQRANALYHNLQDALVRIERATSVKEMAALACEKVSRLCGFDRVMMYRFDREWNGEVIAEERRADLEPFLGLHYPASDIPKQARELYTKNWLRFIADRDYVASPILAAHATAPPLDLSYSVLRSVSPIHLQYLRNMGVYASMSISILRQGKLWGLIACHHYSPKFIPYDLRKASELLGHFMSLQIAAVDEQETRELRKRQLTCCDKVMTNLSRDEDFAKGALFSEPTLIDCIDSGGAAIVSDGIVSRIGHTPSEDEIRQIAAWLLERGEDVTAIDNLSSQFGGGYLAAVAAGVLAVNIGRNRAHQLLWFRPEHVRTVNWAGDPRKTALSQETPDRLSPRGSFALWRETVKGTCEPWTNDEIATADNLRQRMVALLVRRAEMLAMAHADLRLATVEREKALDSERIARHELERLNRVKDEFVATLSHELRTPLNAILGWSQLLKMTGTELSAEFQEGLDVIERNAKAQATMLEDLLEISRIIGGRLRLDLQDVNLATIVEEAVQSSAVTAQAKGVRLEKMIAPLFGVKATGDPNRLRQVAWNLLSNAIKFTPKGGKVQVVLQRVDSHVELTVTDSGIGIKPDLLPYIFDRYRQADASISRSYGGLGLGLAIVRNLVELHGGVVSADSPGEGRGSTFIVSLPIRSVLQEQAADGESHDLHDSHLHEPTFSLAGLSVLILDDEADSRALVARVLESCGARVTAVESPEQALELQAMATFDLIVSDIGMPGMDGFTFIRQWRAREATLQQKKTPAIALTAYARADDRRRALVSGFTSHLPKPVEAGELITLAASLTDRIA
ncbi:ATP-binding protein [Lacipirellula parvula]|uniref:histidine kinase n=1 Tax=Lacipirellula parvula TaxID=2650471 RepID=A0A5K7XJW6_9BACT|nr:ATP-binding protein [Lacipirellula parvula]BBO36432.1 phytochrome [Lacipirellula parvula]